MSSREYQFGGIQWQTQEDADQDVLVEEMHNLIVWNDDVNTFDHVIQSLMEICTIIRNKQNNAP